jgi:hypothetical protein
VSGAVADLHIDDFCRDTARTLVRLYSQFPRPQLLFVEEICGAAETDEFGLPGPRQQACFSALLWLADEGYLRYAETLRQEGLDQVVLTGRGLRLLCSRSAMPWLEGDSPAENHLAQLRRALASGSSTQLQRTVHHLLGARVLD